MEKSGASLCGAVRFESHNVPDTSSSRHREHRRRGTGLKLPIGIFASHMPDSYAHVAGALTQYGGAS
ncbi:MAG: hypothetical protein ABJF86_17015 [Tateyamaria sp.]|uniref:hypothetical protein n=1 Tax=Tateyamaria sp. TaxID=1929288 RepID=UPI003288CF6A